MGVIYTSIYIFCYRVFIKVWGCFLFYILEVGEIVNGGERARSFLKVVESRDSRSELGWYLVKSGVWVR